MYIIECFDTSYLLADSCLCCIRHIAGSGVSTDIWTSYSAMIMAVSVFPFIVVQFPQIMHSDSGRHLAVLIGLIVSVSLLVAYCVYQVNIDTTMHI